MPGMIGEVRPSVTWVTDTATDSPLSPLPAPRSPLPAVRLRGVSYRERRTTRIFTDYKRLAAHSQLHRQIALHLITVRGGYYLEKGHSFARGFRGGDVMQLTDEVTCVLEAVEDLKTLVRCLRVNRWWSALAKQEIEKLAFGEALHASGCTRRTLLDCTGVSSSVAQTYTGSVKHRDGSTYILYPLPATLYRIVEDHGGLSGLQRRRAVRLQRSVALSSEDRCTHRRKQLVAALQRTQCRTLATSLPCSRFINDGIGSAEAVAERVAYQRWLHDYTDYACQVELEVQAVVDEIGDEIGDTADVRRTCSERVQCLYSAPVHWPWMGEYDTG